MKILRCKTCRLPDVDRVNQLLREGYPYGDICGEFPTLKSYNLSRHSRHIGLPSRIVYVHKKAPVVLPKAALAEFLLSAPFETAVWRIVQGILKAKEEDAGE